MSDEFQTETDSPDEGETNAMREAREAARRNAEEAKSLKRENVFLKAGVPLDNPVGKLLYDGYDGELEVEAIQGRWGEISGSLQGSPPAESNPPVDEGQLSERAALSGGEPGAGIPETPDEHPFSAGFKAFEDRVASGTSRQSAAAEFLDRVIDAGVKGDERVLWNGFSEEQLRAGEI